MLHHRRGKLIALGLRTTHGIPLELLGKASLEKAQSLATENLLKLTETHLSLIQLGRPLVDPIAAELI